MHYTQLDLGRWPFISKIEDGPDNMLTIYISPRIKDPNSSVPQEENPAVQKLLEGATHMVADEEELWAITFDCYHAYQVANESYCWGNKQDVYVEGKTIKRYKESAFLASIATTTEVETAKQVQDKKELYHYYVGSNNHVIYVASFYEPEVALLTKQKES